MAKNLPYPPSPASETLSPDSGILPFGRDACLPAGRRRVTLSFFIAGPLWGMHRLKLVTQNSNGST
jgi:hypothetical protein